MSLQSVHPKAGAAAIGGAAGTLIVAVLDSFPAIHLSATLPAAIAGFTAALAAFLWPSADSSTPTTSTQTTTPGPGAG